jgi:urease gamma subunit
LEYKENGGQSLLKFCEERGLPYFTIRKRFVSLEKRLAKGGGLAESEVISTVQRKIAETARKMTEAQIGIGEKITSILADHAAKKHGVPPSRLHTFPWEKEVAEWRAAHENYERIVEELEDLRRIVNYYESNYGPIEHARNLIRLINESAVALALLRKVGFKINRSSGVVKLINENIAKFARMGMSYG